MKLWSRRVVFSIGMLSIFIFGLFLSYELPKDGNNETTTDFEQPETSTSPVNGRTLSVNQYANISKTFTDVGTDENVSFPLLPGWTSKNVTINYEGVSRKKEWTTNGEFTDNADDWDYVENNTGGFFWDEGHVDWEIGGHIGSIWIGVGSGTIPQGNYAGYQQNFSISGEGMSSEYALASCDYYYDPKGGYPNASITLSVLIDSIEKRISLPLDDITMEVWDTFYILYDAKTIGQTLPGEVSVFAGITIDDGATHTQTDNLYLDNIKLTLWTELNNTSGIIRAYDNEFNQNYTYTNTDYGEGYAFINQERERNFTDNIVYTIYENLSSTMDFVDFKIDTITINSPAEKIYNSTYVNQDGSSYSYENNVTWDTEFTVGYFPSEYQTWLEIDKPIDWSFYSVMDSYESEKINDCTGTGIGSTKLVVGHEHLIPGKWKLKAYSNNYLTGGAVQYWDDASFTNTTNVTYGDIFQISANLNDSLSLPNTQINCSILYPNASIFWNMSRETSSYNEIFGNFTVGTNMTVGTYTVEITWVNNQSYLDRDKVGFQQLEFNIWHYTNLTAVTSYFEEIAGDPLLIEVNFIDFDFDSSIHFASVTYNSTFGTSGTMVYLGSGVYFVDVDSSSLSLGDYYFSFNASKIYYENQTKMNLVHLKIVAQPLALEVPHYTIEGNANNVISCNINTTGALSGTKLYPANVSTDWFNPYNVTDHNNGTYTLDFSTADIPTSGFLESYTIEIFANKTNYGSTSEFITLIVHPLATEAHVNTSLVSVNSNNVINLKVNYTEQSTTEIITDANCSLTWESSSLITPATDGFNIQLHTTGLAVDYYTALIKLEKEGYEVAYESITVIIVEQDVNLTVTINTEMRSENSLIDSFFQQTINISAKAYALIDEEYLSGGVFTLLGNDFQRNLTESPSTNFSTSLILDGANFSSGINSLFLRFEQANYTTKIFPFQLFIRAQNVNLSALINQQEVPENYLLEQSYNEDFQISCRAFADIEGVFLSGGNLTFINGEYEVALLETANYWFNQTILISTSHFNLGPNYVYLRFQQNNYTTTIFAFQIIVNQIQINVETLDFDGFVSGAPGDTITIRLNLTESNSSNYIDNATVFYSWTFGVGYFDYVGSGIYEVNIDLPTGRGGNFDFELVVSMEGILYETEVYSFFIDVNQVDNPNLWWILTIIGGIALVAIVVLGVFAYKQKVVIPKQQRIVEVLRQKTQVFDDITIIKSILIIETGTGRLMYQQEFGGIKEDHEDIFSGFLHSILTLSNKFALKNGDLGDNQEYAEFTHESFNVLVAAGEKIIVALILEDTSTPDLQARAFKFINEFEGIYASILKRWNGDRAVFNATTPKLFEEIFHLSLLSRFKLTDSENVHLIEKKIITPDSMSDRISQIIKTVSTERSDFLLKTLISLIPKEDQLEAKDVILRFVKNRYLVPVKDGDI